MALDDEEPSTRDALIDAFTRLATERGYSAVQADEVDVAAELPPGSFASAFETKEQCTAIAYDVFVGRLTHQAEEAIDAGLEWPLRVKAAVGTGLGFVAEAALQARFFAVDALTHGGPLVLDRYIAAMNRLAAQLREGREHFPEAAGLPDVTEEVLIGGSAALVTDALMAEEHESLPGLERQLVTTLLLPYLGRERAEEIAG